ncbi:hypothetical protein CH251_14085 [Rhodococcus sp. 06-462-5]|nr:hypothetical protein CH251_14085 [Rhodococcus sp. 06-462-5]OZE63465.1 hypothetical protein CH270_18460 [Rhodococcus sp. 02-925g]
MKQGLTEYPKAWPMDGPEVKGSLPLASTASQSMLLSSAKWSMGRQVARMGRSAASGVVVI